MLVRRAAAYSIIIYLKNIMYEPKRVIAVPLTSASEVRVQLCYYYYVFCSIFFVCVFFFVPVKKYVRSSKMVELLSEQSRSQFYIHT